jgi:ligand-binding sensor domain-containing protein
MKAWSGDGYAFETFGKDRGELPTNPITALAAASDGSLWIGTRADLPNWRLNSGRKLSKTALAVPGCQLPQFTNLKKVR